MRKLKVAVLMGGRSPEHDISLATGREVVKNLDSKKYKVLPIEVSKNGLSWHLKEKNQFLLDSPAIKSIKYQLSSIKSLETVDYSSIIKNLKVDVVFIAMHGPYGEDGTVQGFLELLGVSYTGSGVLASALGMDKLYSRKLFVQAGLTTPNYVIVKPKDNPNIVWRKFKPPVFVHPNNQGSAVGSSLVKKKKQLKKALVVAQKYSNIALVDEYIKGTEVTCAILGNDSPVALPLVEIVSKKEFFDYEAKYNPDLADEIVPARISKSLTNKAQDAALVAYKTIGCRGFGRVDMIIRGEKVYVLEANTIPGLTPVSLFPKAAKAAGLSYPMLLDRIIKYAQV